MDDDHCLPADEADVERQQRGGAGPCRIDVPGQSVRVPQAVRPDLLPRPVDRRERIVVRDTVAPVLANGAGLRMLTQVGDDPEDLANEGI
jgi:hypothetical protein